jgi:hypothetical protein
MNSVFFDCNGHYGSFYMNFQYVDFYNLGCAGCYTGGVRKAAIEMNQWYADATGEVFEIQHATFTGTSGIGPYAGGVTMNNGAGTYLLNDVKTYSSLSPFLLVNPAVSLSTGNWTIEYSYFDTGWYWVGGTSTDFRNMVVNYVVFDGQSVSMSSPHAANSFTNSAIRYLNDGNGSSVSSPGGSQSNIYYYMTTSNTENNNQGVRAIGSTAIAASNIIYELGDGLNLTGHGLLPLTLSSSVPFTLTNSLMLPTAQNKSVYGANINAGMTSEGAQYYSHNVAAFGGCTGGAYYYGEQNVGTANSVSGVDSNILFGLGSTAAGNPICPATGHAASTLVANHFTPSGISNNAVWKYAAVSRWTSGTNAACSPCTSNGTAYDIPTTGAAPGANDKNVAPGFVWQNGGGVAPGIREWALNLHGVPYPGGSISASYDASAAFALFGTGNVQTLLNELFAYIRSQWTPQNPVLWEAGADGADIGAVNVPMVQHMPPGAMTP